MLIACANDQKNDVIAQGLSKRTQFAPPEIVNFSQLHDTLKPSKIFLKDESPPITKIAGLPTVTQLPIAISLIDSLPVIHPDQGKGLFNNYTSDDGLAMDAINFGKTTICDSWGNLWFATQGGGVSKYDGKSFITYTTEQGLANNSVRSIVEDKSGNLWLGTYGGGVSKYDGESFITYTSEQGLANNSVFSIAEDKSGNLWFGTNGGGVSKYDGSSFTTYTSEQGLANNSVFSIAEDESGNLWFGTYGGGVSKYNGRTFITYTTEQGLANNYILSIEEDKSGNLWFGTYGGGVNKYDRKTFITYTTEHGLANNSIFSIAEDKSGNLWFGTNGQGVSKYDGSSFITYTTEQGLVNNSVLSIAEDKSENLWLGTDGGVSKYGGKSFITYTSEQGLALNSVISIAEDKGRNLWLGTYGAGISRYDGKSFSTYTLDQGLANNSVLSIAEDKSGNLWLGTYGGVSKYDGKSFITYTTDQGLANNSVLSIAEDKNGNLWFGTDSGVSRYNGKSFITYTIDQGLANNSVRCIVEDKNGNLWFGTSGGLSKYDRESFITYTTEQGLANNSVFSIAEDKSGNLWLGTSGGGVSVLLAQSEKEIKEQNNNFVSTNNMFLTYNTEHGLPDNGICALRFDYEGNLIVGTNFGLAVISEKQVMQMVSKQIHGNLKNLNVYNQFTGYPIRDVNAAHNNGSMHLDHKGILWVGHGNNGVSRVDLTEVNRSIAPPNVVINKLILKGENVCFYSLVSSGMDKEKELSSKQDSTILAQQEIATYGKVLSRAERDTLNKRLSGITFDIINKFYPLPKSLVLPYEHNALTIEFNAIETGRNFLVNYQYMLKGMDDTWSPITKKSEATYNNLSEGDYTFILKAQSPWGVWSDPIEFNFSILPPWYRSWWAYTIYLLLFVQLVWLLIRLQTRRLKQRQKELEIKVDTATKEIREQKNEADKQRDEVSKQKEIVEEAHKEIKDSIQYAKRIQSAILPAHNLVKEYLPYSFIFYKPKDVVAGDFYWMEYRDGKVLFAAADCTGHGVPGAMISVVCNYALNKSVREHGLTEPGEILDKTREIVVHEFEKSEEEVKDGMDIALCSLEGNILKYAGANNPLWVIRNGEILETKADKQPIGKFDNPLPYSNQTSELQKGDAIYIFSDGFSDQFGGEKGKKFKTTNFRKLLLSIQNESMESQREIINTAFEEWKGSLEQVDDVCIIGVKVE